ncbi:tartrate dehydrogenase [Sporolactobacillus vineae]|uniref:tartrate dehydrogenase n=1 Tax=Sporolactobacillus vineae TaxID=444463 RepID=UPI0002895730|nr:tartrate dehydrogenase [Sporolactobacillus vineae]
MKNLKVAVIPGDGIGKEVVPAAIHVLDTLCRVRGGLKFQWTWLPWSCDYYLEHGEMMPDDGLAFLKKFDAVFLGSVGDPAKVPDHLSLWGLLINIRRGFEQTLNIRPAKYLDGIASPLAHPDNFDILFVRENSEGEYSEIGGRIFRGDNEIAIQNAVFSRRAIKRAMRYAFKAAESRKGHVTSATKSNGITYTMPFWDEVFHEVAAEFPDVRADQFHIDALSAKLVMHPEFFDVIVASNLFGDILTDLGAALMGSIGIAPSANINMAGEFPSMFEPVHGSAPDIAGKNLANPIGQIWTAKMMLDHFGAFEMGKLLLDAVQHTLEKGIKTPDIGGRNTTDEVAKAIQDELSGQHEL